MNPLYFASPAHWRKWLSDHYDTEPELWVGFYKRSSGEPSLTWPEAVDHALCFGWIDGIRKGVDARCYVIRFTPRRPRSTWSLVNTKRVQALTEQGLMRPPGLEVFRARTSSGVYSYEQRKTAKLGRAFEATLKANRAAWQYFHAQPPGYRKTASWWVISAKREDTRLRRLALLIAASAQGRRIAPLARN
jgi:uncharacterized protein YdeI (YjbR/CyaY-like superfamily)